MSEQAGRGVVKVEPRVFGAHGSEASSNWEADTLSARLQKTGVMLQDAEAHLAALLVRLAGPGLADQKAVRVLDQELPPALEAAAQLVECGVRILDLARQLDSVV